MRAAKPRDFASHPHMPERIFKRALECEGNLGDGKFRHIGLLGLAQFTGFGVMIDHPTTLAMSWRAVNRQMRYFTVALPAGN
jgi:hypothetical protein